MNQELLAMIDYLEQEKQIEKSVLFNIIEEAIASVYAKEFGEELNPEVSINRKNGDFTLLIDMLVVDEVLDKRCEISLKDALKEGHEVEVEDMVRWKLDQNQLSRIAAQNTRQAILQRLRSYEKDRVVEEFQENVGELLSGTVRYFEKGECIIDFGKAQGGLGQRHRMPGEFYDAGDHITVYLMEVDSKKAGPSLICSRTHPDLVTKLFEREVTEIGNDLVEIKSIARDPGRRTKIAVHSDSIDPVGACIGIRGSRVKSICQELNREKLDIIKWSDDIREYVADCFKPVKIEKSKVALKKKIIEIFIAKEDMIGVVGKKGYNIRLTEQLTGWTIRVREFVGEVEKSMDDMIAEAKVNLTKVEAITPEIAESLVKNGFTSLDGISDTAATDLASAIGISEEDAEAIIAGANEKTH